MNDSQRSAVESHVHSEVWNRMKASLAKKLLAGVAVVTALLLLSQMNNAKKDDDLYRARRYVVTPELLSALERGPAELVPITQVARREAAKEQKKKTRVGSVDELFNLLYRQTAEAASIAKTRQEAQKKWDDRITTLSNHIDTFASQEGEASTDGHRKTQIEHGNEIASLVYSRATAAAERAAELAQLDAAATSKKSDLRNAFEDLNAERKARTSRPTIFSDDNMATANAVLSVFLDNDHPVHAVFDVFWYALLVVAVLGLIYLMLVPLYRLLPFGGVQEAIEKKSDNFFPRSPSSGGGLSSAVRSTVGVVSAVAISMAAIGGPIAHAAGNPFSDSFAAGSHASGEHQTKELNKKVDRNGDGPTQGPKKPEPEPPLTSTTPPTNTSGPMTLPPATTCSTDCATDVGTQIDILKKNYQILINRQPPSLENYAKNDDVAAAIKKHAEEERLQRDFAIDQSVANAIKRETNHAIAEAAEREKLASRLSGVESHLANIDNRSVSHARAADRPAGVERVVGVDRYVITTAAVDAIEDRYPLDPEHPENEAIRKAVAAMQSAKQAISRTQIEWQIDRAVGAAAGTDTPELREKIHRAKQLVVELSRRPE